MQRSTDHLYVIEIDIFFHYFLCFQIFYIRYLELRQVTCSSLSMSCILCLQKWLKHLLIFFNGSTIKHFTCIIYCRCLLSFPFCSCVLRCWRLVFDWSMFLEKVCASKISFAGRKNQKPILFECKRHKNFKKCLFAKFYMLDNRIFPIIHIRRIYCIMKIP